MANVEIMLPSVPGHGLSVRRFDIVDGLSRPFEVALVATSKEPDLDFERLIGADATCKIESGALGRRTFSGVCSFVEQLEVEATGVSTYLLRIVPRLWLLSLRRGHRVFQHQTALEIARTVLGERRVALTARVTEANLARHELRVQYGETDLDFVSRLLEEAGLSYFFESDGEASRLVLTDGPEHAEALATPLRYTSEPAAAWRVPFITDVHIGHEMQPGLVTLADFDFRRPLYPLFYRAASPGPGEARLERYSYAPGASIADVSPPNAPSAAHAATDTPVADDRSHARADEHHGNRLAERRLEALRDERRRVTYATNLIALAPGSVFTIAGAPRAELAADRRLVVVQENLDGDIDGLWTVRGVAAFADAQVRPARRVPWPRIDGLQSAAVIGPVGEEIYVDEFGRVRVRFHWDREDTQGLAHAPLAQSSAWVRVDEGWAGEGFGMMAIPRVGEEVLLGFYEGNPDQPVIVGRVHGGSNPAPLGLPAGAAMSTWRTRSTPGGDGHHELTFDDAAGRERVFLRSERDLEKVVQNDETETTDEDRIMVVGKHLGTTIGTDDAITVGQVHEVRMAKIAEARVSDQGQPSLTPLDTRREIIARRITLTTGGATLQLDGPDIVVTAQHEVRIKAGGTVFIQGEPYVHINPPMITRKGDDAKAPDPGDHLVWFRLVSEGNAVAGARVHVEHADGSTSSPQVTDGGGHVRLPVDKAGSYQLRLGDPPKKPAAPAPHEAPPKKPAAAVIHLGETPAQRTAKAKPTEHDPGLEIEILSPAPGTKLSIHPGAHPGPGPSMPWVHVQAQVRFKGQPVTVGSVRWELSISGEYRVRHHRPHVKGERNSTFHDYRQQPFKYAAGTARTRPNETLKVQLLPAEIVGGDLEIKVTFEGGPELGNLTATRVVKGLSVVGENPPRDAVEALITEKTGDLAWLFLRMFCHESDHTLAQFKGEQPRYGPPSGVGIAQHDPEEAEWVWPKDVLSAPNNLFPRVFWDWKKNVIDGIDCFHSGCIAAAHREIARLRRHHPDLPEPPVGLVMRSAIRHYNGGNELGASADGAHYTVAPHTIPANVGYVDWVLDDPHGHEAPKHPVPADARARVWPPR